jgi:hypothetical protein
LLIIFCVAKYSCKEDIENADRVLGLLQDLENIRADRLRMGMLSVAKATFDGERVNSIQVLLLYCTEDTIVCVCVRLHYFFHLLTPDHRASYLLFLVKQRFVYGNSFYQEVFSSVYANI